MLFVDMPIVMKEKWKSHFTRDGFETNVVMMRLFIRYIICFFCYYIGRGIFFPFFFASPEDLINNMEGLFS